MKENLISFLSGSIGALLSGGFWDICLNALGTALIAFLGGALGYLGKETVKLIKERRKQRKARKNKNHEKNNQTVL